MASKTSAVAGDDPIEVLFALHHKFNLVDFAGPLQILTSALNDAEDASELQPFAFVANPATTPQTTSEQGNLSARSSPSQDAVLTHALM